RVVDFRRHGGVDLLVHLLGAATAEGEMPLDLLAHLLELRRMLAVEVVGLAVQRATPARIRGLREAVDELATRVADPAAFMEGDLRFARLLVEVSGNIALELLLNSIVRMLESQPGVELAFGLVAGESVAMYRRLLRLFEAGRAAAARAEA